MTYFQAIILGLAQGLSEFLPISSSGHLALLQYFFDVSSDNVLPFAVLLHLGTLVSVFIVYWRDIVAPVSYTHLDVYKRQVLDPPTGKRKRRQGEVQANR